MDTSIESTTDPTNCTAKTSQQIPVIPTTKVRVYITTTRPSAHTPAIENPKDITDGNTSKDGATSKGETTGNATAFPPTGGPTYKEIKQGGCTLPQHAEQTGADEINHPGRNDDILKRGATETCTKLVGKEAFSARTSQRRAWRVHWQVYGISETHKKNQNTATYTATRMPSR